ncbi:MAG: FAD/NAD(P)-binding protein [Defluviitaleaceae bacterium]|nr:FAD/NAD(P)-binding protein [Defluviitaleaceae bacterium]
MTANPYLPHKAEILSITQETFSDLDVKTYQLKFAGGYKMDFLPGQFVELSVPGVGEAPFGFASDPFEKDYIELTIKRTGVLTDAIHALGVGDTLWVRGPFGNTFPIDQLKGRDILIIGGGIGLAPLRPLICYMFNPSQRDSFGKINMLIAARSSSDLIYRSQYDEWKKQTATEVALTIDREEPDWTQLVGFPHQLISNIPFDKEKTTAVLCGPPIMIKAVAQKLLEAGLTSDQIITTLEMRMTCGIGKCGKCNIGHEYICVDGPVYSLEKLNSMPDEY